MGKKSRWSLVWKIPLIIVLVIVLAAGGYIAYLYMSYHRLPDTQSIVPLSNQEGRIEVEKSLTAQTYNIGYGSYPPDYSFFMDGGNQSVAESNQTVNREINGVITTTKTNNPDIALYQEIDTDGDRSQHVNEVNLVTSAFKNTKSIIYGQNYDSAYLFMPIWPFGTPIGKAKSGLETILPSSITSATRYSLPIDTDFNKFSDLDRAFTVVTTPTSNGKQLQIINIHMSAYTKNHDIQEAQFKKLFDYINQAYQEGNYVMVGGDYNHAILPNSNEVFHTGSEILTWTHPFPYNELPAGFYVPSQGLAEIAIPSARALNEPYTPGRTLTTLIDGFVLSPNITTNSIHVDNTGFKYSDHNPVVLSFKLNS